MFKFRIKNLNNVKSFLNKVFQDTKTSTQLLNDIAHYSTERIRAETRSGRQMTNERAKFPSLTDRYMQYRQRLKKRAEEGKIFKITPDPDFFRPRVANNTLTGQLMKSLKYELTSSGIIKITPTGKRDDGLSNVQVAEELAEKDRGFLAIDSKGIEVIKGKVLREFRRQLKK